MRTREKLSPTTRTRTCRHGFAAPTSTNTDKHTPTEARKHGQTFENHASDGSCRRCQLVDCFLFFVFSPASKGVIINMEQSGMVI
mmetsp:Transcript_9699/g.15013  ORF Transcript_9699/g.15013 Transcript_9699/m.15013 type:complete len:85 (+) Transcript_9699:1160-1414(+)